MMTKLPSRLILLLVAAMIGSTASAAVPRDPYVYFFNETFGDFSEELTRAREEGKKGVVLFFEMDECPFCHRMKRTVLNQVEVQNYYRENFLIFPVDIEGDIDIVDFDGDEMTQKEFAVEKNRVRATPVFAYYDLDGQQVARYTGATSGTNEFLLLGEFVAGAHYKTTRFTRYKREKRKQSAAQ